MLEEDAARVYAKRSDDFSCAVAPVNFQKNRYGNILPCTFPCCAGERASEREKWITDQDCEPLRHDSVPLERRHRTCSLLSEVYVRSCVHVLCARGGEREWMGRQETAEERENVRAR